MTQEERIAFLTESRYPLIPFAWDPYGITLKAQLSTELASNHPGIAEIHYGHSHIEISTDPHNHESGHNMGISSIRETIMLFLSSKDIDPVMITEYIIDDRQNRTKYILDINFILP